MNLTLIHRNVRMYIGYASLLAEALYQLNDEVPIEEATARFEGVEKSGGAILITIEVMTASSRIFVSGSSPEPSSAVLCVLDKLQRELRLPSRHCSDHPRFRPGECGALCRSN